MEIKSLKTIDIYKKNKILLIILFLIIFSYYLNFDFNSGKGTLIKIAQQNEFEAINQSYGLWGYISQSIFSFIYYFLGKLFSSTTIWEITFGLQLSLIWSLLIFKITKFLNNYFSLILLHPYILNYLSQCSRDAIAFGLFLLLAYEGWNIIKFTLSILISFAVHKAILPFIIILTFFKKFQYKTKKFFFINVLISILISTFIFIVLRYTDLSMIIPRSLYGDIIRYPRMWFTRSEVLLKSFYIGKNLVYNLAGDFNLKILSFGLTGQLLALLFKEKLKYNIFLLCFSTFFLCSIFSSMPNANRFTYHALIISSPFYSSLIFNNLKSIIFPSRN